LQKILKNPVHVDRIKPVVEREEDFAKEDSTVVDGEGVHAHLDGFNQVAHPDKGLIAAASSPQVKLPDSEDKIHTGDTTDIGIQGSNDLGCIPDIRNARQVQGKEDEVNGLIGDGVYDIERIVNVRGTGRNRKYLVKWKPIGTEKFKDSWVAEKDVTQLAIDKFHERKTTSGHTRAEFRRGRKRHKDLRRD
jgi:hypothetical protein